MIACIYISSCFFSLSKYFSGKGGLTPYVGNDLVTYMHRISVRVVCSCILRAVSANGHCEIIEYFIEASKQASKT